MHHLSFLHLPLLLSVIFHLRLTFSLSHRLKWGFDSLRSPAVDDPRKIVKVVAQDGKTGDTRDLAYTNCKVIGNGSFGIVFQAKLLDEQPPLSEIAIKKVLQDKRFKVRHDTFSTPSSYTALVVYHSLQCKRGHKLYCAGTYFIVLYC